jgi:tryptophan synthase beta subunit
MKQKYNLPTESGYFGEFGGRFVPPQLEKVLEKLEKKYLIFDRPRIYQGSTILLCQLRE